LHGRQARPPLAWPDEGVPPARTSFHQRSPIVTEHPLPSRRPRFIRPRAHQSTGLALVLAVAAIPAVQAADCNGVKPWLGSTIYQPGDTLQKADVLYQARQTIWNAPPDHPAGRRYYDSLGRCEAGPPAANIPRRCA